MHPSLRAKSRSKFLLIHNTVEMSNSCSHDIQIINFENGESVNQPILLVKGKINKRCSSEVDITLQVVEVIDNNRRQQKQLQATQLGYNSDFKFLIDLRGLEHLNLELIFTYCNSQRHLKVEYAVASNSYYHLQPLYIICPGEKGDELCTNEITETACQLIDVNLLLVQCLYAEKLRENGFGRLSFKLNGNCQIFQSTLTCREAWNSTEDELWQTFGKEILNSRLGENSKLKFVAFIDCTRYDGAAVASQGDFSYANIRRNLKAHAALGGGGLALFGSGYFYAWPRRFSDIIPCFQNEQKVDLAKLPDDSNYRRTYGGVYATSLGAVCHELGHIFDLGHTADGIMGSGFDYLNRVFTVNTLTECLPKRQLQRGVLEASEVLATPRFPSFTKLRSQTGTFLEKYREQKCDDGCGFTRNCAVILAHHLWIREPHDGDILIDCDKQELEFDAGTQSVRCGKSDTLKLIELRCKTNSMVKLFYEFKGLQDEEPVSLFTLPKCARELNNTHYIFVITTRGCIKRFDFNVEIDQQ